MADEQEENVVDADKPAQDDPQAVADAKWRLKQRWNHFWHGPNGSKPKEEREPIPLYSSVEEEEDDFKRQRRLIESFSEDYLSWADRMKLSAVKFVAFALPVAAVLAVGTDIGRFFAPALGEFSSYLLSFSIEAGIAGLTIMLGMAAQKGNEGVGHWVKFSIAAAVWLIASLASGLVMYVIALTTMPAFHSNLYYTVIGLRTAATMLIDLISISILFFKGKGLQRYLHEMSQKSHAIVTVNEAELTITRAQEQARMRQKEDEQYLEGKARAQAVVSELQEMTNQALIDVARRNLLKSPDEGNNRRIGRY